MEALKINEIEFTSVNFFPPDIKPNDVQPKILKRVYINHKYFITVHEYNLTAFLEKIKVLFSEYSEL
jgi:hypothetical protein